MIIKILNSRGGESVGAKYTESQAKAATKYMQDKHTFRLVVTHERKDIIKAHAEKYDNGNVTAFLNRAVDYMIKCDTESNDNN